MIAIAAEPARRLGGQVGKTIQAMREAQGLTLEQLAERAGCEAGYLSVSSVASGTRAATFLAHLAEVPHEY